MPKPGAGASSEFRIFETDEFVKSLKKLPRKDSGFLQRKLQEYVYPQLRKNPFLGPNIKKLKGYTPDTWRYRIADFRLFFFVDQADRIVFLLSVDDRKDAYR
jgi:mRNA interferase RelE/StbE